MGHDKALHVSRAALSGEHWDLVISTGFAAALCQCKVGTMMVAQEVLNDQTSPAEDPRESPLLRCDPGFRDKAFSIAMSIDAASQLGKIVTVSHIVTRAEEKRHIADRTQAIALDMESWTLGSESRKQNIPFIATRAISDLVDEDFPIDFNQFLHPRGWVKGIIMVMLQPSSWKHFLRLRRQTELASHQITKFFVEFLADPNPLTSQQP